MGHFGGVGLVVFGHVVVHLLEFWVCFDDGVVYEGVGVLPVVVGWDVWFAGDVGVLEVGLEGVGVVDDYGDLSSVVGEF